MQGVKHLIQCHCVLPQFKNTTNPVFHKFVVFSLVDDSDTVQPKFAQCNNCGVVHKVVDLCKSELTSKEESRSIPTIQDIELSVGADLASLLKSYDCDLATWEQAEWIVLSKAYDNFVILSKEEIDDEIHGKRLLFLENGRFRIEAF